jgi:hypothetical protein
MHEKTGNPRVTFRVASILEELGYERKRVWQGRARAYVYVPAPRRSVPSIPP